MSNTIEPFIRDIALMQQFRRRDYDRANRLVQIAAEHNIASTLSMQASEALERLVAFSGLAEGRT
jgi:hypothetical protein